MVMLDAGRPRRGFTLIEMMVVMAILAALLAIAAPRYFESLEHAKETALRADLKAMREAIDKFRGDTGKFPPSLEQLVADRYLSIVPVDPVTDSAIGWIVVSHPDGRTGGVFDVRSGSKQRARDGSAYASW
jgi:general secretion pathway protein G